MQVSDACRPTSLGARRGGGVSAGREGAICGIWLSIGLPPEPGRLARVAHRGPDGEGWRVFASPAGPVAMGHRRLAIIDTSEGGSQPRCDASGRYWLSFNGEIYNYIELRAELAAAGVRCRTESDSEVLLEAVALWGRRALDKLAGMFAFVVWDDRDKVLLAARDRFGIKPLYLAPTPDGVAFASEIKQLHDLPGLPRRMHLGRVHQFLEHGVLDHSGDTMFAGVRQVRGGELVEIDCRSWRPGTDVATASWYRLPAAGSIDLDREAAGRRFRELFEGSIAQHLRSDVRLGSCLSGGLVSSAIVIEASRHHGPGHPMTTVSAVFDEPRVDERRYMEAVIASAAAEPHWTSFGAERVMELAGTAVWHQDEPFGSTSILAQWLVFEAARRAGVKVMLDGQGADEMLGGYHYLFRYRLADMIRRGRLTDAAGLVRARRRLHRASPVAQIAEAAALLAPGTLRASARRRRRTAGGGDWLAGPLLAPFAGGPDPDAPDAHERHRGSLLAEALGRLVTATSLPMLLHWEDRNSMAHGIEARVPFLDHRLVELAIGLGDRHKIDGTVTKVLLRDAIGARLPGIVTARTDKLGFATPEQEWLVGPLAGPMREAVRATLDAHPDLLDRTATLAFADAVLAGRRPADFTLWRIACLGIWSRRFGVTA